MMGGSDEEAYDREKPVHPVRLSTFYLARYPVTQALWQTVMEENPAHVKGADHPVESVSWQDTQKFIKQLNESSGNIYRLPTEAEWEFAARGGTQTEGYLYAGSDKLSEVGWYEQNSGESTRAVGQLLPNELGFHDMSGNVVEWCEDWYGGEYYQLCLDQGLVENPGGSVEGSHRVLRGGYWYGDAHDCRGSYRHLVRPRRRYAYIGFRLALSPLSAGAFLGKT